MLSFEIADGGRAIQVCCDQKGLETLICELEKLRGTAAEISLYSPSRGGKDLSDKDPWGVKTVPEVRILTGGD